MSPFDLSAILPELILTLTGLTLMLLGAFQKNGSRRGQSTVALLGVAAAAFAVLEPRRPELVYTEMFSIDPFGNFFRVLFLVIAALVILCSADYLRRERLAESEYYALLLFATVGMSLMAAANELMLIFIGLEISSLSSYILVGYRRNVSASSEAALKYFLLGSFATAFLLYGIALLFGVTGSTRLTDVRAMLHGGQTPITAFSQPVYRAPELVALPVQIPWQEAGFPTALVAVAISLIFVGFAFKVSAAPFQVWTPDVYQGAPAPVAAFLSTGPKAAAFAAFLRVFQFSLAGSAEQWSAALWASAALTMFIGNLGAMWQTNVKRLLAYSSIAHAGYILVAFAAHSTDGTAAVLYYLVAYSFMNIGAFAVITHLSNQRERHVELEDYAGLGYRFPLLAGCLTIFLLSLIGIPLTGGFLGKFYAFRASLRADLVWLTILGVLNSAIAAYYYLRVIVAMYMQTPIREVPCERLSPATRGVLALCMAATFLLGVFPQAVLRLAIRAARWFPEG